MKKIILEHTYQYCTTQEVTEEQLESNNIPDDPLKVEGSEWVETDIVDKIDS